MKTFELLLKFQLICSKGPINNISELVKIMAWLRVSVNRTKSVMPILLFQFPNHINKCVYFYWSYL